MLAFVFLTYFFLLLSFCLRPSFLLSFFGWLFASLLGGLIEAAFVCQVGHCAPRQEAQELMPVRHQGLQVLAHVVWVLIFTNTSTSAWAPHLGGAACVVQLGILAQNLQTAVTGTNLPRTNSKAFGHEYETIVGPQ